MKKLLVIIIVILFTGCQSNDAMKFKTEYEKINNKAVEGSDKTYLEMTIDKSNPFIYASYDEIVDIIKKDTAVIYFGFPECPWCRNAIPVLIDAAKELGIDKIYYYNALSIRDKKSLDDNGKIVVENEGTKEYKELVKLLYDFLPEYSGLNDATIKRLYFPTVLFVKKGQIVGLHTSTVDSQKDPYKKLSEDQYNELKNIYLDYINKAYDIVCGDAC